MVRLMLKVKKFFQRTLGLVEDDKYFFTKDFFREKKYIIGDYTYGKPTILFDNKDANLIIGKYCSIAFGVEIFLGGNHRIDWITTYPFNALPAYFPESKNVKGHPATKGSVIIGNDVWIGRKVTNMSGVEIGNGAVIASNSVVTKNIGAYEVWGGNPVKFIRKRFSDDKIELLEKLQWWDWDIEKVRENIEVLQSENLDKLL